MEIIAVPEAITFNGKPVRVIRKYETVVDSVFLGYFSPAVNRIVWVVGLVDVENFISMAAVDTYPKAVKDFQQEVQATDQRIYSH